VEKADTAKFREAEKAATAHKIPPVQETSQGEQKTEAPEKPENPNIIGNTSFKDIADKKYMKMDTAVALRVADELEKQGIKFSGRVGGEKTTLTINATDVEICRAIAKGIREANITTPEPEQVAAEKLPDVVNPDLPQPDCSFSILQLKDVPESRDIRFEPLEALESRGIKLTNEDYNVVFSELLTATAVQNPQLLEDIFVRFNENIPDGFAGHSLSVSDVILVQNGDDVKAHYCDKVGFTEMSDFIVKEAEQFKEYPPLYLESIAYAAQNEEKHLFVESTELNNACAADIDKAILSVETNMGMPGANTYDLPKALEAVTGIYGSERVNAVVAHVVNTHDFDGRLSDDNKKWARLMETPQVEYIPLNTHLAVFDGFVNCVRAEQEKEIIIGMMLDELQNGEPEDYGGASGLAEIKETLQAKPVEELRAELKEMVVQGEIDVSEHIAEHLERNSDIHEKSEKPTLSELQSAVDKGESISLTDLAEAVKEEKIPDKPEKPAKAEKKPKKSIKGRIEADKAEKRANAEKSEPAPKKNKGEAEL
ncbi:MAG: DUF3849 domain-containing protein, partial [Oscillospiraceae bacterium]|jgi:hypothetical protein|nr:DUF3849 domain-containing protein [Oscillospiraceae bacterium]